MQPSYPLPRFKELVQQGKYRITVSAFQTAALIDFLDEDIVECIVEFLAPSHFYKTMTAEQRPGLMQDVYKITYVGKRVCLKVQINDGGSAVIVSFKEDDSFAG